MRRRTLDLRLAVATCGVVLLFMGSAGADGHLPGGLITRNPYVIAAKFVL